MFEPMHFLISSSNPPSAQTSPARSQGDYHATTGTAVSSGGYVTSLHGSIAGAQGLPMSFPGSLSGSNTANNNSNNSSANISSGGSVGQFAGSTTQIAASKIPNHPNNQRDGARVVSSDIRADGHRRKGGKNVNT